MEKKYLNREQNNDYGDEVFYSVLIPDLFIFATAISISVALLILIFKLFG